MCSQGSVHGFGPTHKLLRTTNQKLFLLVLVLFTYIGFEQCFGQDKVLLHSFSNKTTVSPWTFINGAEFPGATGSLTIIKDGFQGLNSARLTYNLTLGAYVAAIYNFPTPATFSKMVFSLRYSCTQNTKVSLRLTDSTGQTFQMGGILMPFDSLMKGWSEIYMQPAASSEYWGGANDGVMHYPIKQMSIVLGLIDKLSSTAGCIDFDNFYIMNDTVVNLNLSNHVPVPWAGDMLSRMGVCVHSANSAELSAAKDAGFSMIRIDLFWTNVESKYGVYTWGGYDTIVSGLKSRNMTALFILTYGNSLYNAPGGGFNETTITAFANYARAAAKHFAGTGTTFEIYNEANGHGFTGTTYAELAKAAIRAVHEGDSTAKVSTTGMAGFDYNFLINELIGGAGIEADAIGLHPYGVGYNGNPVVSMVDSARRFLNYMDLYLNGKRLKVPPVWDTEMGLTSTDYDPNNTNNGLDATAMRIQANLAVERLLASMAVGFEMFHYYDLRNDGSNPTEREHNFGLLFNNYTEKPAMKAVKQLSNMVRGKIFDGFIKTSPSALTAMRFKNENETTIVVFAHLFNVNTRMTVFETPKSVVDIFNNPLSVSQNSLTITDKDGPIYLTFNTPKVSPQSSVTPKSSSITPTSSNRVVGNSTITNSGIKLRCCIVMMIIAIILQTFIN